MNTPECEFRRPAARRHHIRRLAAAALVLAPLAAAGTAIAGELRVEPVSVNDPKAVFATVESSNVVPARARIGGTVTALKVNRGDMVREGEVIATVTDDKLALQLEALDAQIEGAKASLDKAQLDQGRVEKLRLTGTVSQAQQDAARTAVDVAETTLAARTAERAVVAQQQAEGQIRAPATGRVLTVPATIGSVLMPGEPVATVAEGNYVLRLSLPETHARTLATGDEVRIDAADLGEHVAPAGRITLIYPQVENGRVIADAAVAGLGDYFVGERVRVWVPGAERKAFVVPAGALTTRFGIDYVALKAADGNTISVPVQPGRPLPRPGLADGIEILSGLAAGDVVVTP
ncbi:efflux RND transporter periplasmic adaptor subunit [Pseudoxanthobacter sp.]|uniref:efflux RND transporter periplasmic adaptor subunit n=1 Tax=Pseudoxanthobacter sp. TaxID=1925742 RepID=UPI002FE05EA4